MKKIIILALFSFLFLVTVVTARSSFSDIKITDWFYDYVETIKDWGIINGNDDGTFAPSRNINRAEFAKMLTLYDKRVDEKIENISSGGPSNETWLPSVMYLEKFNEIPNECPNGWEEANYGVNWEDGGQKSRVRSCYNPNTPCHTMHLEAFNEVPRECPPDWSEANFGQKWVVGGRKKYARTCYICAE